MEITIEQALRQGVAAHKEGKIQEAERLYRAILQSQPAHPDANHNLGVLAVSVNRVEAALPLLKTAVEANPEIEQFWLSYINALIKEKQFDDAKQFLDKAKMQDVAEEKLNVLETQLISTAQTHEAKLISQSKNLKFSDKRKKLSGHKKQKKAIKQKLKANNPPQEQLNDLLELHKNGRFSEAEKLAVYITQEFPKHQFGWKVLGAVLGQIGRKAEAVDANQAAVALSPQDAAAHYNLGNSLKGLGRLDEAEASYNRAIALQPDYIAAYYNLGVTFQELGRLDEAEASYNQAIALQPDYAEALNNLGITVHELGRLDEAEASYNQAIALQPDYAEYHNNLGITLKELGRLNEAEASYNQAIALKPDYAEAHYNLGKILYDFGCKSSALSSIKRANVLDPNSNYTSLLLNVLQRKIARESPEGNLENLTTPDYNKLPPPKILVLNRLVEPELTAYLYRTNLLDLDKESDPSFGAARGSKYDLFEDNHATIQKLAADLKGILMEAFKSDIYIFDSFFSIFGAGAGTARHSHLNKEDKDLTFSLGKQKYSLVYYLSVGDQECSDPGYLNFYDPSEEILPSNGMITIFPANREHSSVYGGNEDRVLVGVNFYTL